MGCLYFVLNDVELGLAASGLKGLQFYLVVDLYSKQDTVSLLSYGGSGGVFGHESSYHSSNIRLLNGGYTVSHLVPDSWDAAIGLISLYTSSVLMYLINLMHIVFKLL